MERGTELKSKGHLLAKADKIAADLSSRINCDGVYISLANRSLLFSFGMTGLDISEDTARIHKFSDTVCGVTTTKNECQIVADARMNEELMNIPYVASGGIVGYLGQPIRDVESNAIGAICATSDNPRIWSEVDKLNLQLACLEAQHLLATELLRHETNCLTQTLSDYDNIILAIRSNAKILASIHSSDGKLMFATSALLEEMNLPELQKILSGQHIAPRHKKAASHQVPYAQAVDNMQSDNWLISAKLKNDDCWYATIQEVSNSMLFVSWSRKRDQTN